MDKTQKQVGELSLPGVPKGIGERIRGFVAEVSGTRFYEPDGKPEKEWRVFYGKSLGEASHKAFLGRLYYKNYIYEGPPLWVRAQDAGKLAAQKAGRDEAYSALTRHLHKVVNGNKTLKRDSGAVIIYINLVALYILVSDLDFNGREEYSERVMAYWNVLRKGYGFVGDVDGTLFAFRKGRPHDDGAVAIRSEPPGQT